MYAVTLVEEGQEEEPEWGVGNTSLLYYVAKQHSLDLSLVGAQHITILSEHKGGSVMKLSTFHFPKEGKYGYQRINKNCALNTTQRNKTR